MMQEETDTEIKNGKASGQGVINIEILKWNTSINNHYLINITWKQGTNGNEKKLYYYNI